MKHDVFAKFMLCCVMLFTMQYCFAQKTITGKVTDANGNPIPYASVVGRGTEGIVADSNGIFKIKVQPSERTLMVSHIGFITQEINITDKTNVEVVLVQQSNSLNDRLYVACKNVFECRSIYRTK